MSASARVSALRRDPETTHRVEGSSKDPRLREGGCGRLREGGCGRLREGVCGRSRDWSGANLRVEGSELIHASGVEEGEKKEEGQGQGRRDGKNERDCAR
eukprot:240850-Rhodomonas_salina.1